MSTTALPRVERATKGAAKSTAKGEGPTSAAASSTAGGWEAGALVALVVLASAFGLVALYSASAAKAAAEGAAPYAYAARQAVGCGIGAVLAAIVSRVPYHRLRDWAWPMLIGVSLALLVVVMPGTEAIAPRVNGARRWLRIGFQIQPSEFAKLVVVVWTAALAVKKQGRLHSMSKGLLPFLLVWGTTAVLMLAEPDLSGALLVILLSSLVLFAGGARIGHFILLAVVAVPALWYKIQSTTYQRNRVLAFLDPNADPQGITYQIYQSLVAVGSGGWAGLGLGRSRQKWGFLPESHNDFLVSIIGEEWGLVGIMGVLGIFLLIAAVGYRIAHRAPDLFGYLLAVGMTNLLVVSALLHIGVAFALLPTTDIGLPFMSYGRSALLATFLALGTLLSVARAGIPDAERTR